MADYWTDDEELLAELGEALRTAREVPASFIEAGKSAFSWRDVDAELAALTQDTAVTPELAGIRAEPLSTRALTFAGAETSIEIEVAPDALHGQVVPPQAGELEVRPRAGDTRAVPVDDVGWFVVKPKPVGLFRLRLRTVAGKTVITDWTTL